MCVYGYKIRDTIHTLKTSYTKVLHRSLRQVHEQTTSISILHSLQLQGNFDESYKYKQAGKQTSKQTNEYTTINITYKRLLDQHEQNIQFHHIYIKIGTHILFIMYKNKSRSQFHQRERTTISLFLIILIHTKDIKCL